MNATAHLVFGPIAAGKSTYTAALAKEQRALVFTLDDWMHRLYGADQPQQLQLEWAMPRVARCRDVMWSLAAQALALGTNVVLDTGLMRAADRQVAVAAIQAGGHGWALHFVDAPKEVRQARVMLRNATRGATYSFDVTLAMFDAMEGLFEPPTTIELPHLREAPTT